MSGRMRAAAVPAIAAALLGAAAAPAAADGSLITVVDNSRADSFLEVDRTANVQYRSSGTAGSDHEGSAVEAVSALIGALTPAQQD